MNGEIVPFDGAPRGERELVAAALPDRLQALTAATELPPADLGAMDADALFQLGVKAFQSSTVRMAYAGHCWALAKERAGGGRSWIEARAAEAGIGRQHIYNAIEVLAQLVRAPDGLVQPVGQLDYTKVLLLKKLDDNELEDLAERGETDSGVTLDDIMNRPRRELEKLLTQATHAERHARKKLEVARRHIEQLDAQITAMRERDDWQGALPLSVTEAREDGVACGEFVHECLVRMESLYRTMLVRGDLSEEETLREAQLRAGLIPLHTAVLGVAAGATALLRAMQEQVGEFLPADYTAELALSREECAVVAEKRHYMVTHLDDLPSERRLRNEAVEARAQRLQAKKAGRKRRGGGA